MLFVSPKKGFPAGAEVKASACNVGDLASIPGSGRSPGEGNGNPLQYSCLENPMDGGAWWARVHRSQRVEHNWVTSFSLSHLWKNSYLRLTGVETIKRLFWTLKYCGLEADWKTTQTQTIYYGKEKNDSEYGTNISNGRAKHQNEYSPDKTHAL